MLLYEYNLIASFRIQTKGHCFTREWTVLLLWFTAAFINTYKCDWYYRDICIIVLYFTCPEPLDLSTFKFIERLIRCRLTGQKLQPKPIVHICYNIQILHGQVLALSTPVDQRCLAFASPKLRCKPINIIFFLLFYISMYILYLRMTSSPLI